jgi:hypothetical protein
MVTFTYPAVPDSPVTVKVNWEAVLLNESAVTVLFDSTTKTFWFSKGRKLSEVPLLATTLPEELELLEYPSTLREKAPDACYPLNTVVAVCVSYAGATGKYVTSP